MDVYQEIKNKIRNDYSIERSIDLLQRLVIELKAREKYFYYNYNPLRSNTDKYLRYHLSDAKFKVCIGSPRVGKSTLVFQDNNLLLLEEHPSRKLKGKKPFKEWVIATSFKKIRFQLFPLFKRIIPMNRVRKITEKAGTNEYSIEYDNDSIIVFKSQEEKIGEFKSDDVHIIAPDEYIEREDIRENLRHRIITTNGIITYTMDSLVPDDWIDEMSKLSYTEIFHFELSDNKDYIPAEEFQRLENELSDVQKEKLFYGKYINENHKRIFLDSIWNDINYQPIEPIRGDIEDNQFKENPEGMLCVFKPKSENMKYVIGYDSASGTGGNSNCLQILSEEGEQIARVLNNNIHFTLWPDLIIKYLNYYNKALFVPENRMHAIFVANTMVEKYHNIYIDEIVKKPSRYQRVDWGVLTNEANKKEMCDKTLADLDGKILLHDSKTVRQLNGFVEDYTGDSGKKNPKLHGTKIKDDDELKGSDDDLVIALFLADRALNKYNYFNIARRRKLPEEKKILTIDDLLNVKIIRYGSQVKNYYAS